MRLKGKTALIAGASRNIGREIALTFAREGADLILVASKTGDELKQVAGEDEGCGVRANLLAAGVIGTERRNPEWYPEEGGVPRGIVSGEGDGTPVGRAGSTALKRIGTTREVANVALFLASDESSFVTGDRIICAGGRYM